MRITNPVNITSLPPHSWKDFDFLIKIVTSIEMRTTMKEFHPPAQTRNFRHALERTIFRYPEMVFCGIRYTLSNAIFYPNTPRYGILAFQNSRRYLSRKFTSKNYSAFISRGHHNENPCHRQTFSIISLASVSLRGEASPGSTKSLFIKAANTPAAPFARLAAL